MNAEDPESRIRRMTMRSWRRGTKEMDLVLGPFADQHLSAMSPQVLDLYDSLLTENDQDLYAWVSGVLPVPERYCALLSMVSSYSLSRPRDF